MVEQRELGQNFSEFFKAIKVLDGDPEVREMWSGLRDAGLWVSPKTMESWLIGKTYPSIKFRGSITKIFGLTDEEFAGLQSKANLVLDLVDMPREQLIGALVADVVLGPPLSDEEARSLQGIIKPVIEELF